MRIEIRDILPFMLFHFLIGATPSILVPFYVTLKDTIFHGAFTLLSMSEGAYLICFGALAPLWGILAMNRDRHKLLIVASILYLMSTILLIMSYEPILFGISRALSGASLAAGYPLITSMVSEKYNPLVRTRVFSLLVLSEMTGAMLSSSISLVFYGLSASWRISILVLLIISIINVNLMKSKLVFLPSLEDLFRINIISWEKMIKLGYHRVFKRTNVLIALQSFFYAMAGYTIGKWMIYFIAQKFETSITFASFIWFLNILVYFSYFIARKLDDIKKHSYRMFSLVTSGIILLMAIAYSLIVIIPSEVIGYTEKNVLKVMFDLLSGKLALIIIMNYSLLFVFLVMGGISILSGVQSPAVLSVITDSNLVYERSVSVSLVKVLDSLGSGLGIIVSGILLDMWSGDFTVTIIFASISLLLSSIIWIFISLFIDDEVQYNKILAEKLERIMIKRRLLLDIYLT